MSLIQIISNTCFEELIYSSNPFKGVFNFFLDKWSFDLESKNFEEYFQQACLESFEFEKLLATKDSGLFPRIYDLLVEYCLKYGGKIIKDTFSQNDVCLILLDGFSIREASLIRNKLNTTCNKNIVFDFGFSTLPSDTKHFELRWNKFLKDKQVINVKIQEVSDVNRISPSYPLLIHSPFPDILFHSQIAGYTKIIPVKSIYFQTQEIITNLIQIIKSFGRYTKIIITSDHGYYDKSVGTLKLAKNEMKIMRDIFGASRYASQVRITKNIERLINEKYILEIKNNLIVRGAYSWPISGKFHQISHGGLSLLECIVPIITINGDGI